MVEKSGTIKVILIDEIGEKPECDICYSSGNLVEFEEYDDGYADCLSICRRCLKKAIRELDKHASNVSKG